MSSLFQTPIGRVLSGPESLARATNDLREAQPVDWDRLSEAAPIDLHRPLTTIAEPQTLRARGTFFGKKIRTITLLPTDLEGWWFERADLPGSLPVRCSIRNVWTTGSVVSNIVLRSGSPHNYVRMAEHIIALRMGLGVDNLLIRLESGDPPLFDAGAAPLVEALQAAGTRRLGRPVPFVTVREPVTVVSPSGGFLTFAPPSDPARPLLAIDAALQFPTAIGRQRIRFSVDPATFAYGASARTNASALTVLFCKTFGMAFADIRNLGYNFRNLLVAGRFRYWNRPTHLHDGKSLEAAWHRATLDLLAAVALIDTGLFVGEIVSCKAGHKLDVEMIRRLYQQNLLVPFAPS